MIWTCASMAPSPTPVLRLGFERTVQFITGMQNIRDIIPFPRTPKSAEF